VTVLKKPGFSPRHLSVCSERRARRAFVIPDNLNQKAVPGRKRNTLPAIRARLDGSNFDVMIRTVVPLPENFDFTIGSVVPYRKIVTLRTGTAEVCGAGCLLLVCRPVDIGYIGIVGVYQGLVIQQGCHYLIGKG
jgi:hypothetical protein